MIRTAKITEDEKELLVNFHRNGNSALIRDRALVMILSTEGFPVKAIANSLKRDIDTIRGWIKSFNERRMSSIFPKYRGNNNAGKLGLKQKERIKEVLLGPPSEYGIPKRFWEVKDLKRWIKAEFGVVYESKRSYHFLFKLGRFSWKLADKFDIRRDDDFVRERIKEIRKEIKPLLSSSGWVVLASDETRLVWETESKRAWLRTNEKTIIRVNRSNEYQSFLGSLNLKTRKCHLHALKWQNQEEIIKALKKIKKYYPQKDICIIWDNAKWHKGKLLRKELKKEGSLSSLHLINLPPYAPDTNPQEHIWKYAKDKIAHTPSESFKQRINDFKLAVIHRKFNYEI